MGIKLGRFVSKNGSTYEVRISGNNVADAELTFGVPPVIISMAAGDHKFCGFKSTTATIVIITDTPLIDLYASTPRDVRVEIHEDGALLFYGYVVPFAFDQDYTGQGDAVTISAVDILTARKDIKYANIGDIHGVDLSGLSIVQEICRRAGLTKIVQHLNFNDSNDIMKNASPLDVMVAQAGFLQDEVSDTDALSAICKFFGYTGHIVGDTLYLYDEYCLDVTTAANVYSLSYDAGWTMTAHYTDASGPLSLQTIMASETHNDISVSIERAYDGVKISPSGSDKSVLLPEICSGDTSERTGAYTPVETVNGVDYRKIARSSQYLETGKAAESGLVPFTGTGYLNSSPKNAVDETSDDWRSGSVLVELDRAERTSDGDIVTGNSFSTSYYLWLRDGLWMHSDRRAFVHKKNMRYSHTGGKIVLKCKACITYQLDDEHPILPLDQKKNYLINGPIRLRVGDKYINAVGKMLGGTSYYLNAQVEDNNGIGSQFYNGIIVPTWSQFHESVGFELIFEELPEGQVYLDFWANPDQLSKCYNWMFTSLTIEAVGADIEPFEHNFRELGEQLSVDSMLTARGNNARPCVVTSREYASLYHGGGGYNVDDYGVLQWQLMGRYAQPHAAYKMTVDGNINPFAAVEWEGKAYTVEAYDRDIYDDTTTITID